MTNNTTSTIANYIYNSQNSGQAIVADKVITVREADKAAQELRKAYVATLA
jgi:hypothetical protein